MTEPVWEYFTTIGFYSTSVDFDFKTYKYRAKANYLDAFLRKNGSLISYISAAYVELNENMGQNPVNLLIQGLNEGLSSGVDGRTVIVERILFWTPPNLKANINGQLKEYDKGWVNINGELKEIDKMWTNVNGVLREV